MNMVDFTLLWPPLLAGVMVLSTHVPLGRQVLKRGIIFIDLAVAQLAGLGVIIIHLFIDQPSNWAVQFVAFLTAATGSLGLRWAERHWSDVLEAIIGVVFVLAVTAALILLANDPHGGDRLKDLLAGQLLWVSYEDLWLPALLSLGILVFWFKNSITNQSTLFYGLFALSVTMSVQLVGVYLVFASLIIPALATRHGQSLTFAYGIGMAGYLLGLMASALLDLPTGPIIVWAMALIAVVTAFSNQFANKRKNASNNL